MKSEAQNLINRLFAQGHFTKPLQVTNPPGCTCERRQPESGPARFMWDEACPVHK